MADLIYSDLSCQRYSYSRLIFKPGFWGLFRVMPKQPTDLLTRLQTDLSNPASMLGDWVEVAWNIQFSNNQGFYALSVADAKEYARPPECYLFEKARYIEQHTLPIHVKVDRRWAFGVFWLLYKEPDKEKPTRFHMSKKTDPACVLTLSGNVGQRFVEELLAANGKNRNLTDETGAFYCHASVQPTRRGYAYRFEFFPRSEVEPLLAKMARYPEWLFSLDFFQTYWAPKINPARRYLWIADDMQQARFYTEQGLGAFINKFDDTWERETKPELLEKIKQTAAKKAAGN